MVFNEFLKSLNCIRQSLEELSYSIDFKNLKDLYKIKNSKNEI